MRLNRPLALMLVSSCAWACACVSTDKIDGTGGGTSMKSSGAVGGYGGHGGSTYDVSPVTTTGDVTTGTGGSGNATATTGTGMDPCGNAICENFEDCVSCPADCGQCGPKCGDGTCDANEDCQTCPMDCGACSVCGDGTCAADETCKSCYQDCGICTCKPDGFESNNTSPTATTATSGMKYCDLSICSSDVDWFKFSVAHGFTAKIFFAEGQGDLDLEIYDGKTFNYINGAYSSDDDESVTLSGLAAGMYYARVYGKASAAIHTNPDYCFRVDTN